MSARNGLRRSRRLLPEIPEPVTWQDVLHRAFLADGDLEAAYFEWRAAMARIPQVANYPNTNLAPSFSYLFSAERTKSFNRFTTNVGFDPMENLAFPTKVARAGEVALEQARPAGKRFEAAKFELQRMGGGGGHADHKHKPPPAAGPMGGMKMKTAPDTRASHDCQDH